MIDIIITTYNRLDLLKATLTSFFETTDLSLVGKIVISNDGSTDGTAKYISDTISFYKDIDIVVLENEDERMGIIPRFNDAFSKCDSEFVCEFQDDVKFADNWLEKELAVLMSTGKIDFVTGFDAPELTSFGKLYGGVIKHSSRFTQLLARRSTWSKWFPMKPIHDHPTPSIVDGKCIGSKIDLALSDFKRNPANGKTKFLVLPGLVEHTAETNGSTWRTDDYRGICDSYKRNSSEGGLRYREVKNYWHERSRIQGSIAVGYAGKSKVTQEKILSDKFDLILPRINPSVHAIDYGCGVGNFSKFFSPDLYLGVDITKEFIKEARKNNPGYSYIVTPTPSLGVDIGRGFEQFMTVNVLQHNCDSVVSSILRSLHRIKKSGFVLVMYENTDPKKKDLKHMRFRKMQDYVDLVSSVFSINDTELCQHIVHGEEHSLIKIFV